jgi:hypothetical protein
MTSSTSTPAGRGFLAVERVPAILNLFFVTKVKVRKQQSRVGPL